MTVVWPDGRKLTARESEGHIILEEEEKGLGYDPLFVPLGHNRTFGKCLQKKKTVSVIGEGVTELARLLSAQYEQ